MTSNNINSYCFLIFTLFCGLTTSLTLDNDNITFIYNIKPDDGISINLYHAGIEKLSGHIGAGLTLQLTAVCEETSICFISPNNDDIALSITHVDKGFGLHWRSSNVSRIFQDCFQLNQTEQFWSWGRVGYPLNLKIQNYTFPKFPYIVTSETPVSERYWYNSIGGYIFVNETTPLFVDQNNLIDDNLCLIGQIEAPYHDKNIVSLNYTIGANENAREAHFDAIINLLGRPSGNPDSKMIKDPSWSTSNTYPKDIFNDSLLLQFAQDVKSNGFLGQIQIEDGWEDCYGSLTFDQMQFPDIYKTLMDIYGMALRITLRAHPFVNDECENATQIGRENNYFVKNESGSDITSWWNGDVSHIIDFTYENATDWFVERLQFYIDEYWMYGFNFDFGETDWLPTNPILYENMDYAPGYYTKKYNNMTDITTFISVNSGFRTQDKPVFIRIPEKEPNWGNENGLKSVITNLLQLNMAGYTLVAPSKIGGNGEKPSPELYVRWTQAVSLMPQMQFGHLPWNINSTEFDVLEIVKNSVDLHWWYSDKIRNVMIKSRTMGRPVNGPVWWIEPDNQQVFNIDDQFMLSEDFLIAPVLTEGAVSRDVYLPPGIWMDGNDQITLYEGNQTLKNFPAPIDVLPFFVLRPDSTKDNFS